MTTESPEPAEFTHPLLQGDDTPAPVPEASEAEAESEVEVAAEEGDGNGLPEDTGELKSMVSSLHTQVEQLDNHNKGLYAQLQRNKQALKRLDEIEQKFGPLGEMVERLVAKEAPTEEPPDPEVDPSGYAAFESRKTREEVGELKKEVKARSEQDQRAELEEAVVSFIEEGEAAFAAQNPDYEEAADFWTGIKASELEGYGASEEEIVTALTNLEFQMAAVAKKQGTTVAQLRYQQAKLWGFTPTPAEQEGEEDGEAEPEAPVPAPAVRRRAERAKKAQSVEGVTGHQSAKGGSGKKLKTVLANADPPTYNRIMNALVVMFGSEAEAMRQVEDEDLTDAVLR